MTFVQKQSDLDEKYGDWMKVKFPVKGTPAYEYTPDSINL